MNLETNPQPTPARSVDPLLDDALQARLAALASKRKAEPTGPTPPAPPTARTATRRRHPAKHSRAAALALSFVTTGGLGYLLAVTDPGVSAAPSAPAGVVTPTATAPAASTTAAPAPVRSAPTASDTIPPAAAPAPTNTPGAVADPVVVNGQSFTNKFGPVQVQATFAPDGTLISVDALQVPTADGKSVRINNYAVPRLNSEGLTAQNADVDTISGATYTSDGYRQSLQSAIDIAVANGIPAASSAA